MNPREIEVHIAELVLHGFAPETRWNVADALENKLRGLLREGGIPRFWHSSPETLDAGAIRPASLTKPAVAGAQIAGAIYRGRAQ
jgi:hypothetical protein